MKLVLVTCGGLDETSPYSLGPLNVGSPVDDAVLRGSRRGGLEEVYHWRRALRV